VSRTDVRVKLFASVREIVGQREVTLEVPDGTTAGELLAVFVARYPRLTELAACCRLVVNRQYVEPTTVVKSGDEVAFVPPVSGGELFEVTEGPLSVEPLVQEVVKDTIGAVVTFIGVVRGFSRGKRVRFLEYEAYKEMAEEKLAELGAEVKQKWGLTEIAIRHRVGHLEIGEIAVVIAVASPHRQEAFEACEYAINQLKKNVPVWKKEVWEDGEVWVGWEGA